MLENRPQVCQNKVFLSRLRDSLDKSIMQITPAKPCCHLVVSSFQKILSSFAKLPLSNHCLPSILSIEPATDLKIPRLPNDIRLSFHNCLLDANDCMMPLRPFYRGFGSSSKSFNVAQDVPDIRQYGFKPKFKHNPSATMAELQILNKSLSILSNFVMQPANGKRFKLR